MLFSELCGKMILDMNTGMILGTVGEADLLIDEITGKIKALLLAKPQSRYYYHSMAEEMQIRWQNIKTIGPEIIVADVKGDLIPY